MILFLAVQIMIFFYIFFLKKVVESGNFDLHLRSKGTKQDESTTRRVRM